MSATAAASTPESSLQDVETFALAYRSLTWARARGPDPRKAAHLARARGRFESARSAHVPCFGWCPQLRSIVDGLVQEGLIAAAGAPPAARGHDTAGADVSRLQPDTAGADFRFRRITASCARIESP